MSKGQVISCTVGELIAVLWDGDVADLNHGCYPGTDIPKRAVLEDAMVCVYDRGTIEVEDEEGGWIADRVCDSPLKSRATLGRRNWIALAAAIHPS